MQSVSRSLCKRLHSESHSLKWALRMASTESVPAGHHSSDLSSATCNISLNRLRDITLRQDLIVKVDGDSKTLTDVFKGVSSLVLGLPDCGSVCKQQHVPGYISRMEEFKSAGFGNILIASVASPDYLSKFAEETNASRSGIQMLSDQSGGFTRMLGLEINDADTSAPFSQRYAAFVQDGILVRLNIELEPGEVKVTDAETSLKTIAGLFA